LNASLNKCLATMEDCSVCLCINALAYMMIMLDIIKMSLGIKNWQYIFKGGGVSSWYVSEMRINSVVYTAVGMYIPFKSKLVDVRVLLICSLGWLSVSIHEKL